MTSKPRRTYAIYHVEPDGSWLRVGTIRASGDTHSEVSAYVRKRLPNLDPSHTEIARVTAKMEFHRVKMDAA